MTDELRAPSIQTLTKQEWTVLFGILAWALIQSEQVRQEETNADTSTSEKAGIVIQY